LLNAIDIDDAAPRSGKGGQAGIRCFSTGLVRPKRGERGARRYLPGGWGDQTLPVNVFLIEHPDGMCLFDAGQTALAARSGHFAWWYPFFRLARFELGSEDEAVAQLRGAGVEADAVRWVVLSHLHTDHVGGLAPFASSEIVVTRTEWERAVGLRGRLRGYLPQYWPPAANPRPIDFSDPPIGPFPGSRDLAGDGRLVLVPTPGHTPGHASLLVRTEDRSFLCAGDMAKSAAQLHEVAPQVAQFCRENGIVVLTTHDRRAPELLARGEVA